MSARLITTRSEAEWLAERRKGVTASEIAVLMGLSPYSSPFELYHRKIGNLPDQADHAALERGRVLEPFVAGKFAELHPEFGVGGDGRALFASLERPWQLATPDRIIFDAARISGPNLAVLETKTDASPGSEWGEDGSDEIPVHYRCQVLWQMDVLGVTAGYVACLFVQPWKVRVYELAYDSRAEDDLDLMRNEADSFLARVASGTEPDVDWRPATAAALKQLHPSVEDIDITVSRTLAGQYRGACAAYKKAEQRKKLAENRLRARLAGGRRVLDPSGQLVASRQVYDVKEHTRRASTVDKLVPVRPPKETAS